MGCPSKTDTLSGALLSVNHVVIVVAVIRTPIVSLEGLG